ncbi:MAG: OsmC family protein [Bdellovibrionaceae bacterium]|nr:OsmC family protein [Bdellovibrio sp.]
MVQITATYTGELHCKANHGPSGSTIETDAPKDNQGRGERFSPTDLIAAALGTCILTTIAIVAERDGQNILGSKISVEKEMNPNPRRIASLKTVIELPKAIPEDYRGKIEHVANACPVKKSLHPDILFPVEIRYTL